MNKKHSVVFLVCLVVVATMAPGCGVVNRLRAKDNLNEGVREFNKGKYDVAQAKFERALQLSPEMTNAQLFYARAVNARFDQALTEDLGITTIKAYDDIINRNPDNPKALDQSLAFKAKVYDQLAKINPDKAEEYKQKNREALMARAELPTSDNKTKAAVYYTIGQGYWEQAYTLSQPYTKVYQGKIEELPVPPEVAEKMRPLIQKAHEFLQKAISVQPDYADAWAIQKLTYVQENKIETNPARRTEIAAGINEADKNARKYYEQQREQAAQATQSGAAQ